ncbi:hypothetical protein PoB_005116000 [Plakobranchus ocellatus]|uniref:Uncharacterized protein n=1 Tax=Plakobranchus ocellatus TaxID=259542 RepID=A0AAV4BW14_9GAST|nr:hypothetical protein PoB_005116000 [Plakobranchus ocellatus]
MSPRKFCLWKRLPSTAECMSLQTRTALQMGVRETGGSTSRVCGFVGEQTCSIDCELKAVTECFKVITRRHQGENALSSVVIFTECGVLPLGGSDREDVGEEVLLAGHLQKIEGVGQCYSGYLPR